MTEQEARKLAAAKLREFGALRKDAKRRKEPEGEEKKNAAAWRHVMQRTFDQLARENKTAYDILRMKYLDGMTDEACAEELCIGRSTYLRLKTLGLNRVLRIAAYEQLFRP